MSLLPPVRAMMHERFLFNFRLPPDLLAAHLPAPWLQPHMIGDHSIISFCTLNLKHITVAPLPTIVGLHSLSCAYRFAVVDTLQPRPVPAVYVPDRYTSSPFGSWFTHLGFSAPHPLVSAAIDRTGRTSTIRIAYPDGRLLFRAQVAAAPALQSELFESAGAFADFIRAGVTSYGSSIRGRQLTKVDLDKTETVFEPLTVLDWDDALLSTWGPQVQLDSAFRTAHGQYQWTYHGLIPAAGPTQRRT